jgi:hypothetical protein
MKILALLILSGLFPYFLSAQQGAVKGNLSDSTFQPLSNATISVLQKKDSSLVGYTMSDSKGFFELKNLSIGDFQLFISFTGYEVYKRTFSISAVTRIADFGTIILNPEFKTLIGVVVTDASPVKMKGDTISFKASAFNSKPNATVEEVLKKYREYKYKEMERLKQWANRCKKYMWMEKNFLGPILKLQPRI